MDIILYQEHFTKKSYVKKQKLAKIRYKLSIFGFPVILIKSGKGVGVRG